MLGPRIRVLARKGFDVHLGPIDLKDGATLSQYLAYTSVTSTTRMVFAPSREAEEAWILEKAKDPDEVVWGIYFEGVFIGVTGLHHIRNIDNSCSSGIIIFNSNYWNMGIASAAHLARTAFAIRQNRFIVRSTVHRGNHPSAYALLSVGYSLNCSQEAGAFVNGSWITLDHFLWINPQYQSVVFPDGTPEIFHAGIVRAQAAIDSFKERVFFL